MEVVQLASRGLAVYNHLKALWGSTSLKFYGKHLVATAGREQKWTGIRDKIKSSGIPLIHEYITLCAQDYLQQAELSRATEWKTDNAKWLDFRIMALSGSCGAGHRFSKPIGQQSSSKPVLGDQLFASTASTRQLAAQALKWDTLWIDSMHHKQGSTTQLPFVERLTVPQTAVDSGADAMDTLWQDKIMQSIPPISVKQLRGVAKSFKQNTTHVDGWHPRQFADLSDGALETLTALIHACEASGQWPMVPQSLHVSKLPKLDGDRRPILQFRSAFRLWSRIRSSIVNIGFVNWVWQSVR